MTRAAALALLALLAPRALEAQGDALRAPRPDVSLAGAPFLATELLPPGTGQVSQPRATNWPLQGLDFEIREDLPAATFVVWLRTDNTSTDCLPGLLSFTVRPVLRAKSPAKTYLRVLRGVGPVVLQGHARASGTDAEGVGWAHAVLASDQAAVLDLGAGQAVTNAPGATLERTLRAKDGGDVTLSAATNAVWSLTLATPRIRRGLGVVSDGAIPNTAQGWRMVAVTIAVTTPGTLDVRRTFWPQAGGGPEAYAHTLPISEPDDALPGPATILPFQCLSLVGKYGWAIDPDRRSAPVHAWGKKMWRRALSDEELRAVFEADLGALRRQGLATP